jgi:hypothetical protein
MTWGEDSSFTAPSRKTCGRLVLVGLAGEGFVVMNAFIQPADPSKTTDVLSYRRPRSTGASRLAVPHAPRFGLLYPGMTAGG